VIKWRLAVSVWYLHGNVGKFCPIQQWKKINWMQMFWNSKSLIIEHVLFPMHMVWEICFSSYCFSRHTDLLVAAFQRFGQCHGQFVNLQWSIWSCAGNGFLELPHSVDSTASCGCNSCRKLCYHQTFSNVSSISRPGCQPHPQILRPGDSYTGCLGWARKLCTILFA